MQEDFCKEPWGTDAGGCNYWLHDLGKGRGLRLCREQPPVEPADAATEPAGEGKRARMAPDAQAGAWATVACGIDEIEAVGVQLRKSRRRDDVALGEALTDELVADFREREAERVAAEAAEAARLQAEVELEEAGRSRKLRERKKARTPHRHAVRGTLREGNEC